MADLSRQNTNHVMKKLDIDLQIKKMEHGMMDDAVVVFSPNILLCFLEGNWI